MKILLNKHLFLVPLLFFFSCDREKIYDTYVPINTAGWDASFSIEFKVDVNAVKGAEFDYLIGLRNNNDYLYSNIFLFLDVETPSGVAYTDTLQYLLARPDGKWVGAGLGSIKHNLFKYKESQSMENGLYKFNISHGMRSELLTGIEDIGFRIEKTN